MKKALTVIGILVIIVAIAMFWLFSSLDGIVKKQIEVVGSELTGTKVSVGGVALELTKGKGRITGLTVANPGGYETSNAFDMKLLQLGLDLESIGKSPLILDELVIDAPRVTMETNAKGQSNLKQISDNVSANTAKADKAADEQQKAAGGEPLRILIRKLVIKDLGYQVKTPVKQLENAEGTLPTITLSNVGGKNGGTPAEIGKVVIGDLTKRVIKRAAEAGVRTAVEEKVKEKMGGLGGMLDKLGK